MSHTGPVHTDLQMLHYWEDSNENSLFVGRVVALILTSEMYFKFKCVHPVVYVRNILYDLVPSKHNLYII
jgi:hypothetical protein